MLGDGTVKKVCKHLKGGSVKELVRSFHWSIPVMKLALLDEDIVEYLFYMLYLCNL